MAMSIVPLHTVSAQLLHELDRQLDQPERAIWPLARWQNLVAGSPWHARAILVRETPVAVCVADLAHEGQTALVMTLHVHPAWRELGMGSLLLEDLCERAEGQDVHLAVQVPESAERLVGWYERAGFERMPQRVKDMYGPGQDALTLVR
jgi:ribosomal protein S18 acetylase RimI-like enzyme